jgi:hypothetical protein
VSSEVFVPAQLASVVCSASSQLPLMSSTLLSVESAVETSGALIFGRLGGVLTIVTVLLSVEFDVLSSDEVTTTAPVGAICGLRAGDAIAAKAGTPKPTAAIPAVVQMIEFFTGVSFVPM